MSPQVHFGAVPTQVHIATITQKKVVLFQLHLTVFFTECSFLS